MSKPITILKKAWDSAKDTFVGLSWVYREMVAKKSQRQLPLAYLLLFSATLCVMMAPYTISGVIDALAQGDKAQALHWVYANVTLMAVGALLGSCYDVLREHIWNRNYLASNITVLHKLLRQTIETLMSSESSIGAEHAESIKDKVSNILYLFLFELSTALLTILGGCILLFFSDTVGGVVMLALTGFNIVWFFVWNAEMNARMEPIDEEFRGAQSSLVECLTFATSVKGAGVEHKVEAVIGAKIAKPLRADLTLWAVWWQGLELVRKSMNVVVPGLVLWYGVAVADWSLGTISVMASWMYIMVQQYQNIGHMMRHLASNIARLKAARIELGKPRPFEYDEGIIYQPKGGAHAL